MRYLNDREGQDIVGYYKYLGDETGGQRKDMDALENAMGSLCPGVEKQELDDFICRLKNGQEKFRNACRNCDCLESGITCEETFDMITAGMSLPQKRGVYLQIYEWGRQLNSAEGVQEAVQAMPTEEMAMQPDKDQREMAIVQMDDLALFTAKKLSAINVGKTDPVLLGAAVYAAELRGDIPSCCCGNPEMLGAVLEAGKILGEERIKLTDAGITDDEQDERLFCLAAGLAAVLVGAAVMLAVGVFITPVLEGAAAGAAEAAAGTAAVSPIGSLIAKLGMSSLAGGFGVVLQAVASAAAVITSMAGGTALGFTSGVFIYTASGKLREIYRNHQSKAISEAVISANVENNMEELRFASVNV